MLTPMTEENIDEEWQRSEEALRHLQIGEASQSLPAPPNQRNNVNNSGQIFDESPKVPDFIDSALSDTLQNPQERMNILKFENKILHFVKSRFGWNIFAMSDLILDSDTDLVCSSCLIERKFSIFLPCPTLSIGYWCTVSRSGFNSNTHTLILPQQQM